MIVNKALTDAKREGFVAALPEAYGPAEAAERFPYQQERVIRVEYAGEWYRFKVQAECDTDDDYAAGTLLAAKDLKRPQFGLALHYVYNFTAEGLRQIADLLDNPLENFIEPAQEAVTAGEMMGL